MHRWLADAVRVTQTGLPASPAGNAFIELREVDEIRARLIEHARQFHDWVRDLCFAVGRALPDWWVSGWSNALYVADCLAAKLSGLAGDWTHMAPEWPLDSPTNIPLGTNESLRVRGRIDLILARGERTRSRLGFADLWLIDYKTGRQRGLNLHERRSREASAEKFRKLLIKGRGVQLALYALATHALSAANVQLALLGLADELENLGDAKRRPRKHGRGQALSAHETPSIAADVHDPHLGDAGAGIEGQLRAAVVDARGLGDLHGEQHVGRAGVPFRVEIGARPEEGEVRLRLGPAAQHDRILDSHDRAPAKSGGRHMPGA